jgi:hypothetical protein
VLGFDGDYFDAKPHVFPATADATVDASSTSNQGKTTGLTAASNAWAFLRFEVAGVEPPVKSATLRCFAPIYGTKGGVAAYATSNDWEETKITWANKPALGEKLADAGNVPDGTWAEFDVTAAVTRDGTYSFALAPITTDGMICWSREATSSTPELVVTASW